MWYTSIPNDVSYSISGSMPSPITSDSRYRDIIINYIVTLSLKINIMFRVELISRITQVGYKGSAMSEL